MTVCKFGLFYLHFRGVTPCVSSRSGGGGQEEDHRGPHQSSSPGQRQRNDHQVHLSSETSTHVLIDTHYTVASIHVSSYLISCSSFILSPSLRLCFSFLSSPHSIYSSHSLMWYFCISSLSLFCSLSFSLR